MLNVGAVASLNENVSSSQTLRAERYIVLRREAQFTLDFVLPMLLSSVSLIPIATS